MAGDDGRLRLDVRSVKKSGVHHTQKTSRTCPAGTINENRLPAHQLRGRAELDLNGTRVVAEPGETVTIPAGLPHTFWNAGDEGTAKGCPGREWFIEGYSPHV